MSIGGVTPCVSSASRSTSTPPATPVPAVGGPPIANLGAALPVADRVQLELVFSQAELAEGGVAELDDLDVGDRVRRAEALQPPLPELPPATELRTLTAPHRLEVEQPHRLRQSVHAVLEIRARDRGGAFRTQRQSAFAVQYGLVHLFAG